MDKNLEIDSISRLTMLSRQLEDIISELADAGHLVAAAHLQAAVEDLRVRIGNHQIERK